MPDNMWSDLHIWYFDETHQFIFCIVVVVVVICLPDIYLHCFVKTGVKYHQ